MYAPQLQENEIVSAQNYFRHHLKLIESHVPTDAVVSGSLREANGTVEATIRVSSPNLQAIYRKRDANGFIAIDKAIEDFNTSILHETPKEDLVYPLIAQ